MAHVLTSVWAKHVTWPSPPLMGKRAVCDTLEGRGEYGWNNITNYPSHQRHNWTPAFYFTGAACPHARPRMGTIDIAAKLTTHHIAQPRSPRHKGYIPQSRAVREGLPGLIWKLFEGTLSLLPNRTQ